MISPNASLPVSATPTSDYGDAFPNSRRVHVDGPHGIRVPFREIHLSGGEPPLRVYDTGGPRIVDVRAGLPPLRVAWIRARGDVVETGRQQSIDDTPASLLRSVLRAKPGSRPTQMAYARRGEVTPEMQYIALREGFDPELVRAEVARGRAIIPANINHPEL